MTRFHRSIFLLFVGLTCLASSLYYVLLTTHLRPGEANYSIFKGVILNDSLMYDGSLWIAIKIDRLDLATAVSWVRNYPTLLPMTLTAYVLQALGIAGVVFNLFILVLVAWLILRIAQILQLGFPYFAMSFVFLNTMTVYFSQSYTKEILLLLFFVMLIYGLCLNRLRYIVFPLVGIGLIRVYFLPPLLLFFVCRKIMKKWPTFPLFRSIGALFLLGATIVPLLLANNPFLLAARIMQTNLKATSGITHSYLKFAEYPLIPVLFIPIKVVQNLFEPLLSRQFGISKGAVDMAHLMAMGNAAIHVFFCFYLLFERRKLKFLISTHSARKLGQGWGIAHDLVFMLMASLLMFSLLPYVQMRYLYPLIPGFGIFLDLIRSQRLPYSARDALESKRSV